jgi:hypothetical protein
MAAETGAQYEAKVKAAQETIAAYDHKLDTIAGEIFDHCPDDGSFWNTTPAIDFRPLMRDYARSKELDPMLLESEWLYNAVVPRMIRTIMESMCEDNDSPLMVHVDPEDQIAMANDDAKWVETIDACHGYKFQTYKYAEFIQVAQGKEVPLTPYVREKVSPEVARARAAVAARGHQYRMHIDRILDQERFGFGGDDYEEDDSD